MSNYLYGGKFRIVSRQTYGGKNNYTVQACVMHGLAHGTFRDVETFTHLNCLAPLANACAYAEHLYDQLENHSTEKVVQT